MLKRAFNYTHKSEDAGPMNGKSIWEQNKQRNGDDARRYGSGQMLDEASYDCSYIVRGHQDTYVCKTSYLSREDEGGCACVYS